MPVQELDNFRKKYPEYGDMDDSALATRLAEKYPDSYSDLPGKVLAQSSNVPSPARTPGFWGTLGDIGLNTIKTVGDQALGAIETPVGLASGILASAAGKVAGAGTSAYAGLMGDPNYGKTAQDVRNKVTEALTYRPLSESGKQAVNMAGSIMSLPMKPIEYAGNKIEEAGYPNAAYLFKDAAETGLYALPGSEAIRGKLMGGKTYGEALKGIKETVTEGYNKAIRPSVKGRGTSGRIAKEEGKAVDAVTSIIQNKDNIQFTDSSGNVLEPGKLPSGKNEALSQFGQAIEQTKGQLHDQFISMREAAGNKPESLNPVVGFLNDTLSKDKEWLAKHQDVLEYVQKEKDIYENIGQWDLRTINKELTFLNQKTKDFYRNPTPGMNNHNVIDAGIAFNLRKIMDDAITRDQGPGAQGIRNKMGSLLAIEPEVARRIVVDSRRNPKGIYDLTNPFILYELAVNLAKWNPAGMAASGAAYLTKRAILRQNNPNIIVGKMFDKAEKHMNGVTDYGTDLPSPLPPIEPYPSSNYSPSGPSQPWFGPDKKVSALLPAPENMQPWYGQGPVGPGPSEASVVPQSIIPNRGSIAERPTPIKGSERQERVRFVLREKVPEQMPPPPSPTIRPLYAGTPEPSVIRKQIRPYGNWDRIGAKNRKSPLKDLLENK